MCLQVVSFRKAVLQIWLQDCKDAGLQLDWVRNDILHNEGLQGCKVASFQGAMRRVARVGGAGLQSAEQHTVVAGCMVAENPGVGLLQGYVCPPTHRI